MTRAIISPEERSTGPPRMHAAPHQAADPATAWGTAALATSHTAEHVERREPWAVARCNLGWPLWMRAGLPLSKVEMIMGMIQQPASGYRPKESKRGPEERGVVDTCSWLRVIHSNSEEIARVFKVGGGEVCTVGYCSALHRGQCDTCCTWRNPVDTRLSEAPVIP